MKVYAVVVLYNGKKWIDKCFNSLSLSEQPLKIIAIDNASTDNGVDIIKEKYPDVQIIQAEKNLGFGAANNIGIKKAYDDGADFVFLLNQDAWIDSDTIKKLVDVHSKNIEYGIVSPMQLYGSGSALEYVFSLYITPEKCPLLVSDIYTGNVEDRIYTIEFVNAAAWLINRQCISTVGGFSPIFFHYGEDDNYVHRAIYHGFRIGVYPLAKMYHDIENRGTVPLMKNEILRERMMTVQYCQPGRMHELDADIKRYLVYTMKYLIKLSFKRALLSFAHYKKLMNLKKKIKSDVIKSMKPGISFLE